MTALRKDAWTRDLDDAAIRSATYEDFLTRIAPAVKTRAAWKKHRGKLRSDGITVAHIVTLTPAERANSVAVEPPPTIPDREDGASIEDYYDSVKAVTAAKIARQDTPSVVEWRAPDDNWTGLVFLGDIHIGGLIEYDQLERDLHLVESTPGLFCVGTGDYADHFEHSGKIQHAMAGDTVPGSEDQDELVHYVLGRTRKWVAVLAGNHDDWAGEGSVRRLAKHLHAPYVSQAGCSLKLKVGGERYVGYAKHTWRGHSVISTSNESRRFWLEWSDFENADFTILAHFHSPDTHEVERKGQTVAHLRGGTYKLNDSHSARGGFLPEYGPALILLNPFSHETLPFHGPSWRRGVEFLRYLRARPRDETTDTLTNGDGQ